MLTIAMLRGDHLAVDTISNVVAIHADGDKYYISLSNGEQLIYEAEHYRLVVLS